MLIVEPDGLSQFGKIPSKQNDMPEQTSPLLSRGYKFNMQCQVKPLQTQEHRTQPSFSLRGDFKSTSALACMGKAVMPIQVRAHKTWGGQAGGLGLLLAQRCCACTGEP